MDPLEELRRLFGQVFQAEEGGRTYYLIPQLRLPDGCAPERVDALLCPSERDGYQSRLFFAQVIQCRGTPNWNSSVRILDRNWRAYSWKVHQTDLRPAQLIAAHLQGLR